MIFPGFPGVPSFFQVFQVEWEPCHMHSVLTPHPKQCVQIQGDAHIHVPDTYTHAHSVLTPHPKRCVEMQGAARIHAPDTYTHVHSVLTPHSKWCVEIQGVFDFGFVVVRLVRHSGVARFIGAVIWCEP